MSTLHRRHAPTVRAALGSMMLASGAALLTSTAAAGQTVWNCSAEFDPDANPAGVWSYGQSVTRAGPFALLPQTVNINGARFWTVSGFVPWAGKNTSASPAPIADNPVLPPGVMMLHPGFGNVDTIIRWTSPVEGILRLVSDFGGVVIDPDQSTVDIAVLHNGVELFSADVSTHAMTRDARQVAVAVGDTLDFHVGQGSNGTVFNDSTAIDITITACPADFNQDGFINPDDLADFITCFFLQIQFPGACADADFNLDGFINPDDLSDFITAFFLGCP